MQSRGLEGKERLGCVQKIDCKEPCVKYIVCFDEVVTLKALLLLEPSNIAILLVSSSREMLPPLPSIDSFVFCSSAEESSCVEEQRYLFVPEVKIELEYWTGPTMVDSLFMLCWFVLLFHFCILW